MKPLATVALLLLFAGSAAAQAPRSPGPAGIEGRVTDDFRIAVDDARITITRESSGTTYRTTTDARGRYQVLGLPAGKYTVQIIKPALKLAEYRHVQVRAGHITRLNVVLHAGPSAGRTPGCSRGAPASRVEGRPCSPRVLAGTSPPTPSPGPWKSAAPRAANCSI